MTLKQMYDNAKKTKAITPAAKFVAEVAEVTKKSEISVRRWLSEGESAGVPDALTQEVLAKHFNTTPQELFPTA